MSCRILISLAHRESFTTLLSRVHTPRLRKKCETKRELIEAVLNPPLLPTAALELELALSGLLELANACVYVEKQLKTWSRFPTLEHSLAIVSSISGIGIISAL